jgi:hypothetical protein
MHAALEWRRVAGLPRAVLPSVDHRHLDQIAELEAVIEAHDRPVRQRPYRPHRHVLVERLISRRAPHQEQLRVVETLRPFVGVIFRHLVVVPRDQRRHFSMQPLQVRIEPILRIAVAISGQRRRFDLIRMAAHGRPFLLDGFVNVVAEQEHEFRIFVGEMAVGGEIAVLVVRA